MKVLTATSRLQGWRGNDFCHTVEGELVIFAFRCDQDVGDLTRLAQRLSALER